MQAGIALGGRQRPSDTGSFIWLAGGLVGALRRVAAQSTEAHRFAAAHIARILFVPVRRLHRPRSFFPRASTPLAAVAVVYCAAPRCGAPRV